MAAQDRLVRRFDAERGLLAPIVALAQDSAGFLWVGTRAGLYRYDGVEFRRWSPAVIYDPVSTLAVSPQGRVVAVDGEGRILELTRDTVHQWPGSTDRPPASDRVAAFDGAGRLWVIRDGGVSWRDLAGRWEAVPAAAVGGERVRRVWPVAGGHGVLVGTDRGLWEAAAGSAPRKLLAARGVFGAVSLGRGRVVALLGGGGLIDIGPNGMRDLLPPGQWWPPARPIALAERGGTFWIAFDRYLATLAPGQALEVQGPEQGIEAGGPLLVDHEGSLWLGAFEALLQYPEPDTRVWDERHGLPSAHARFLARSGDVVWVTTWQGSGFVRPRGGGWEAQSVGGWMGRMCTVGNGALWIGTDRGIRHIRGSAVTGRGSLRGMVFDGCTPAPDGGLWIASSVGLLHASRSGAVRPVPGSPFSAAGGEVHVVLADRAGRLWAASNERICHTKAEVLQRAGRGEWSCQDLPPGTVHLTSLIELTSGTLWASSNLTGILAHRGDAWKPLPSNRDLPTRGVLNLVPSPAGGVWIVGIGMLQRVAERPDRDGWEVLERLGAWQGLPAASGGDLLEDDDGSIWIATARGVARVPPQARSAAPLPLRVALVDRRVDGRPVAFEGPVGLPHDRNRLELRFAALTFRDPSLVRYQVRLSPEDAWADTRGQPSFRWVDLPAGRYHAEVRASLDGRTWSPAPAAMAFEVSPPWYRTAWALTLFAAAALVPLYGVYRARVVYLLGLERQRTRIAMDLHDEMGSGLASIGILAGVLAAERRADGDPKPIAREVAATAEELGTALSDIVWSLDPHTATLEELAGRLAEHGERLFADDVEFGTEFPAVWPPAPLPLGLRRNLLLIALEAMHNAARHAGPRRVVLELRPTGPGWELAVRDDGSGLSSERERSRSTGRGLRAMRRRAAEIGGEIAWESAPDKGTSVRLRFELPGRRLRLLQRLRARIGRGGEAGPSHDHAGAEAPGNEQH